MWTEEYFAGQLIHFRQRRLAYQVAANNGAVDNESNLALVHCNNRERLVPDSKPKQSEPCLFSPREVSSEVSRAPDPPESLIRVARMVARTSLGETKKKLFPLL